MAADHETFSVLTQEMKHILNNLDTYNRIDPEVPGTLGAYRGLPSLPAPKRQPRMIESDDKNE